METLSLGLLVSVVAIVFAGALVFCTVGFGIGVTSIPLLLLVIDPQSAVVLINSVSIPMFALVIWQTRRYIPYRQTLPALAAGLVGVPVGVFVLSEVNAAYLRIAIALFIIGLTLVAVFGVRRSLPNSLPLTMGAGFGVSVMLNAFGVGGALMALVLLARGLNRHALRGALSLYFIVVESFGVVGYGAAGLLTSERLMLIGAGTLPVALGFGAAVLIVRRMNEQVFRRSVIAAIIITSLVVLVREAFSL